MFSIEKYGNFRSVDKEKFKSQIVLCNTSRGVEEYLTSLTIRHNGKYDKIPHFVISKQGKVYSLLPETSIANIFNTEETNRDKIFIFMENLGWLNKKPFSSDYINWKGDIYNGEVFTKKWRGYNFWDVYPDIQIKNTVLLCLNLMNKFKIQNEFIGHNTKVKDIENFVGVVSKSNYNEVFLDITPSFNFKLFLNELEYEYAQ